MACVHLAKSKPARQAPAAVFFKDIMVLGQIVCSDDVAIMMWRALSYHDVGDMFRWYRKTMKRVDVGGGIGE